MNPIPESKLEFCKSNFVHIYRYSYLNLPYYGKNPFSGRFIVAKNIIYKHFAKNLKYSRKITVIRTKSKRIIPVWERTEEIELNIQMYCYHICLDAAFTGEEMISKQTNKQTH